MRPIKTEIATPRLEGNTGNWWWRQRREDFNRRDGIDDGTKVGSYRPWVGLEPSRMRLDANEPIGE